ncbi:Hemerythrin HHE cation binding domain protein [Nostocoides japonicum T1-X7]|uniref:Hemerythrin HHE cation binding domain protein n=1 Tax=Nostocoides japonicum T1-X7 TaxID=1194083 RepID=A0A077M2G8_9MICO|nr:hemerythrin domain-containing protein [Tetrasphaera japonica]CCH80021.1 Hemerythrin HHE cation binding domain protein [Tetrasphaera japonica T1-X7]
MAERETTRLIAWAQELREVHARFREALRVTRASVTDGVTDDVIPRDLLLHCHGFCAALDSHHRGEDRTLFPAIAAARPQLRPVLALLEQDHAMMAELLLALRHAVDRRAPSEELDRHLEGVAAIMENHFRYEERQLLAVLEDVDLDADPRAALGPF